MTVLADKAEAARRRAICEACPFKRFAICTKCGCPIVSKVNFQGQKCPAGKW